MAHVRIFIVGAVLAGTLCQAQGVPFKSAGILSNPGSQSLGFRFTQVDFPDAQETVLFGENSQALSTGAYHLQGEAWHAFLLEKGTFSPLDPDGILGQMPSYALAVNGRGDVVGQYGNADFSVSHGFVYRCGTVTTIDYPGSSYSAVYGINERGTMIGIFSDAHGAAQGYLLDNGNFTPLVAEGMTNIVPYSINARGDVVGQLTTTNDGVAHGFLRTREGVYTLLDAPGALAGTTTAISINDLGRILGFYSLADGSYHGFLKARNEFLPLDYPGEAVSIPQTINDFQRVVGYFVDADGLSHGFVAEPGR